MKRKGLVTGIMTKAATLFDEVAEGFWIVQSEAERRARGMGPEFDLTPRGRLAELARRAEGTALLADRTWYLDPMEGFPLAVEALQGLAGVRRGGAATTYIKAETLWRKTWEGALDDESIRRAAACRLACDCAAYRAVAEMRAIEAGEAATGKAGGVLQKAAETRRTRGKNIPRKVKDTVLNFLDEEFGGDLKGEGGWEAAWDAFMRSRYYVTAFRKHCDSAPRFREIAEAARKEKARVARIGGQRK